jgi:hypothetical protein
VSRQGRRTVFMALPRRTFHANRLPESHHGMLYLHMGVVKAPVCNLYRQPAAWSLSLRGQPLLLFQQSGRTHTRIEADCVDLLPVINDHERQGERA